MLGAVADFATDPNVGSIALSIIVPAWNEAAGIETMLQRLAPLRARGVEVIVVDGGSSDQTPVLARPLADQVLGAARGRALQMNAGARAAHGTALVFLHADTVLPTAADSLIAAALCSHKWGRFDVSISGEAAMLRVIATLMNLRSRLTGIATGDQALFVRRDSFVAGGNFAPLPLMEDIEFSKRMKRFGPPACLRARVLTSGRRWERNGIWRTIFLMWRLRLAYFFGADPARLARAYQRQPGSQQSRPE